MYNSHSLYWKVKDTTNEYLGPVADRFIERQISGQLHKDPKTLSPEELKDLIDWIRVGVSLLTNDARLVSEYIERLEMLAKGNH